MTQEQLAARAAVAVSTIRKIESCRVVEPGYFTIRSIAAALEAHTDQLHIDDITLDRAHGS